MLKMRENQTRGCFTNRRRLGELDYLLESPDDRAGALGFGRNNVPAAPQRKFNQTLDLEKLQALADALVREVRVRKR